MMFYSISHFFEKVKGNSRWCGECGRRGSSCRQADPEVVQTGDGKLVDLIRLFEGDKGGISALVLRDQDHIVPLQDVFF